MSSTPSQPPRLPDSQVTLAQVDSQATHPLWGVGVEWDPGFWQHFNRDLGVTEADWELVTNRLRWMRPAFVRMMVQTKWCYRDGADFDWESVEMKSLYRHLDFCQAHGITVILTDWGCEPEWLKAPGIADVGDPKYAAAIGQYMQHLIETRKYTCIRYFIMVNEPNLEVKNWERWKKGITQVAEEFKQRKLEGHVALVGSDESGNEKWHRKAVDQLSSILDIYDIHRYTTLEELTSSKLQQIFQAEWAYADTADQVARTQGIAQGQNLRHHLKLVGEAGLFSPGFSSSNNPLHDKYEYGIYMADYAIQAFNASSSAVSAWMLDDSSHPGFTWGMWRDKSEQFRLKPWFYTWALLSRYVQAGDSAPRDPNQYMYGSASPHSLTFDTSGIRGLAVLYPKAPPASSTLPPPPVQSVGVQELTCQWTICLVNRTGQAHTIRVRIPHDSHEVAPRQSFRHYLYAPDSQKVDPDGFPLHVRTTEDDLSEGIDIALPANSFALVTSLPD